MRVLITERIDAAGLERLKSEGFDVDVALELSESGLRDRIAGADALVVRSQTRVTAGVLAAADRLRVIGRAGAGYDNIDLDAATRRGVIVANAPGGNAVSAAEHTVALMLALTRQVVQADRSMRENRWERKRFFGTELRRKLVGIVGLGRVGLEVARRLLGFEARVRAYDPHVGRERAEELGVQLMELDDLLRVCDFVTLHLPRTRETEGMIDAERIALMKPSARLVNCARGGLVDEDALYHALRVGKLAGAAFDVFAAEPPTDRRLFELDCFVGTPHIAAHTEEAQKEVSLLVAQQVVSALRTGIAGNALNIPPINEERLAKLRPWIELAERLATFLGHLAPVALDEVTIGYRGEIHGLDTRIVTAATLRKLLEPAVGPNVNYVNALALARERGIRVREEKSPDAEDYTSLISIEARSGDAIHSVAGTLFHHALPRIVSVDGFPLEAVPDGILLVLRNRDEPGVIGRIGTVLGEHGINVAEFRLGRTEAGGEAVCILNLDDDVPDSALRDLGAVEAILDARVVRFGVEPLTRVSTP